MVVLEEEHKDIDGRNVGSRRLTVDNKQDNGNGPCGGIICARIIVYYILI